MSTSCHPGFTACVRRDIGQSATAAVGRGGGRRGEGEPTALAECGETGRSLRRRCSVCVAPLVRFTGRSGVFWSVSSSGRSLAAARMPSAVASASFAAHAYQMRRTTTHRFRVVLPVSPLRVRASIEVWILLVVAGDAGCARCSSPRRGSRLDAAANRIRHETGRERRKRQKRGDREV